MAGETGERQDRWDDEVHTMMWILSGATLLVFFQIFVVAPLIPTLSEALDAPPR